MSFIKKSKLFALTMAVILILGIVGCLSETGTENGTSAPAEPEDTTVVLTLTKGQTSKEYTLTQLKALSAVSGSGGTMSSTGKITGPNNIRGVAINTILEAVGGISEGEAIRVEAKDGYSMTISQKQMAENNFTTFNATSSQEVAHGDLTVILIYEQNGQPLDESAGPLRLGIASDSGTITEGHWWVKWVIKLDVVEYHEPWTLDLIGHSTASIDNEEFAAGAGTGCDFAEWTDTQNQVWRGIPLKCLIGLVDDDDPTTFNVGLATAGYNVEVKALDGFSRTFASADILAADWIISYLVNGDELPENQWPIRLVGQGLSKGQMVSMVASITIIFPQP